MIFIGSILTTKLSIGNSFFPQKFPKKHKRDTRLAVNKLSEVLQEQFDVVMIAGKNKFNQAPLPTEKDPGLDPFPHFPKIRSQSLEPKALIELPVL